MAESARRPNVLLLVADQHRFDALGCTGSPDVLSPRLDALAAAGTVFETCYVTNPICSPSRASFATGLFPRNHGLWANGVDLADRHPLISRVFADAGYDCGLVGKQHLGPCSTGTERRRDDGYRLYAWSHDPINQSPANAYHRWLAEHHPEVYRRVVLDTGDSAEAGNVAKTATPADVVPVEAHYSHWVAEESISFLTDPDRPRDQPFYLHANFFDPHHPFGAPPEMRDLYDAESLAGPIGSVEELSTKPSTQGEYSRSSYGGHAPGFQDYTRAELLEARAAYYAMISLVDAEVGRVLDALAETGELDDTIVVYTSDHGEMLGDHAIMLKGPMLYDPVVRVPLIIKWADDVARRSRVSEPVQNVDLTTTLLSAAGLAESVYTQGEDLAALAEGVTPEWRDWALVEYRDSGHGATPPTHTTMLRHRDRKLVVWHGSPATGRSRDGELYDLAADPDELTNLYHRPEHAGLREELKDHLIDVMDATEDRRQPRTAQW